MRLFCYYTRIGNLCQIYSKSTDLEHFNQNKITYWIIASTWHHTTNIHVKEIVTSFRTVFPACSASFLRKLTSRWKINKQASLSKQSSQNLTLQSLWLLPQINPCYFNYILIQVNRRFNTKRFKVKARSSELFWTTAIILNLIPVSCYYYANKISCYNDFIFLQLSYS